MLNIALYTNDITLTSQLSDVTIQTSADYVDITFSADGSTLLSGRYYALNGSVIIGNLGELVEHVIVGKTDTNLADCVLTAKAGTESANKSFRVMYCDRSINVADFSAWLKENFLTVAPFRRITADDTVRLYWYAVKSELLAIYVYATFVDSDGNRDTFSMSTGLTQTASANNIYSTRQGIKNIISQIKSVKKLDSITLQSVTIRCGNRSATYFIDPSMDSARKFYFVNCFNIVEQLPIHCETTDKVKSDRSVATLGKKLQFYDVTNSKEYETETAPLSRDECLLIEQMCLSPKVKIQWGEGSETVEDFSAMFEILITDFTCELSDSNRELNKVKFTWQFAEATPKLNLPTTPGIFNSVYNPVYS